MTENTDGQPKGFSGIASLVSDVIDVTPPPRIEKSPAPPKATDPGNAGNPDKNPATTTVSLNAGSEGPQPSNDSGGSSLFWIVLILGLGAGIAGIVYWQTSNTRGKSIPAPVVADLSNTGITTQRPDTAPPNPVPNPAPDPIFTPSPTPAPQTAKVPNTLTLVEDKPKPGQGNVLTLPQIRYCRFEEIRLEAARPIVEQSSEDVLARFNALVDDYNLRCATYRYHPSDLAQIEAEILANRARLQQEGTTRFLVTDPTGLVPRTNDQAGAQDETADIPSNALGGNTTSPIGSDLVSQLAAYLTPQEQESIGSVCQNVLAAQGDVGYQRCVQTHLSKLGGKSRRPDLSGLSPSELESIELACLNDKVLRGPSEYDLCLDHQLADLRKQGARPSLSGLTEQEVEAIETACHTAKITMGPAKYNQCISRQVSAKRNRNNTPDLSFLSASERESIEIVCESSKTVGGAAAYSKCLERHLAELKVQGAPPSLSRFSAAEVREMQAACENAKVTEGPAAYDRCLAAQASLLGK